VLLLIILDEKVVIVNAVLIKRGYGVAVIQSQIAVAVGEIYFEYALVVNVGIVGFFSKTEKGNSWFWRKNFFGCASVQGKNR
jgi:hypothetical protein